MPPTEPADRADVTELRAVLDEELSRLPESYRSAVLLCELEGLSRREAARRLGVSEGTLSSRLARAKARLKDRLVRRGVAPSAAALSALLAREARAVIVPPKLVEATTRAAALVAAGSSTAGVVSTAVATLTEGVLKAMFIAKLRGVALGLAALALAVAGMSATRAQSPGPAPGTGTGQGPVETRLEAVESKLDRLLETLGAAGGVTESKPAPREYRKVAREPSRLPFVRELPRPGEEPKAEAVYAPPEGQNLQPVPVLPSSPAAPDLAHRVEALEGQVRRLEQSLGELTRRLDRLNRESQPPARPSGGLAPESQ